MRDWKKAQATGKVVAVLARMRLAGEHLTSFVDSVKLPICRERIVVGDVTPDFHEVEAARALRSAVAISRRVQLPIGRALCV